MNRKNSSSSLSNSTIVGGLLIGTAIGAATAFLMSKNGKELRDSLSDKCADLSCQAKHIAEQIAEKSASMSSDISSTLFNGSRKRSSNQLNWIIGGLGATILGISTLAYLSRDSSKEMRSNILHTFQTITDTTSRLASDLQDTVHDATENIEDHVSCWVTTAQRFLDTVNGYAKTAAKDFHYSDSRESSLDKAVDWAAFGIKLYQSLKK